MSRRGNYGFERRRREDAKRAKQEAKRRRRADRAQDGVAGPEMGEAESAAVEPGIWEWFSPSRSRVVTSPEGTRPQGDMPDDWILLTDVAEKPDEPPAESDQR
jgi:hypothetical protein